MFEGPDFQVNENMTAEAAMIEDEIDVIMLAAHGDALLARLETKACAEFQKEGLQVGEQGVFQIGFEVFRTFCKAGEFQNVRITDESGDILLTLLFLLQCTLSRLYCIDTHLRGDVISNRESELSEICRCFTNSVHFAFIRFWNSLY